MFSFLRHLVAKGVVLTAACLTFFCLIVCASQQGWATKAYPVDPFVAEPSSGLQHAPTSEILTQNSQEREQPPVGDSQQFMRQLIVGAVDEDKAGNNVCGPNMHIAENLLNSQDDLRRWGKRLLALAVTFPASFGTAFIFTLDNGTTSLLTGNPNLVTPPPPWQTIVGGTVVGGVLLLKNYLLFAQNVAGEDGSLRASLLSARKQSVQKVVAGGVAGAVFVAVAVAKTGFVYTVNLIGAPLAIETLGWMAIVPFGAKLLLQESGNFCRVWPSFLLKTATKIRTLRGIRTAGDEERKELCKRFAYGFRKVINDPDATIILQGRIKLIHDMVEEQTSPLFVRLSDLRATYKQSDKATQEVRDKEIENLKQQITLYQSMGDALILKVLYDFDSEEVYPPGSRHPWWYTTARVGGAAIGAAASGATWYGLTYIPFVAGLSPTASYVIGSMGSSVLVPYMMKMGSDWLGRTASLLGRYNPIKNEEMISDTTVTYDPVTIGVNLLTPIISIFESLPQAIVGGQGMANLGNIPLSTQWWTLVPNMVIWGAIDHNSTEPRLQRFASKIKGWRGRKNTPQQEIANLYGQLNTWVTSLPEEDVLRVREHLDKTIEDWVKKRSGSEPFVESPEAQTFLQAEESVDSNTENRRPRVRQALRSLPLSPEDLEEGASLFQTLGKRDSSAIPQKKGWRTRLWETTSSWLLKKKRAFSPPSETNSLDLRPLAAPFLQQGVPIN